MITRMKKYDFLIYHKDYQHILLKLRELGVIHIVQKQLGIISDDNELVHLIDIDKRYRNVIESLNYIKIEHHLKNCICKINRNVDEIQLLEYVESLFAEKERLYSEREHILKEIDRISPLGEFDPTQITRLADKGVYIHLYEVTESKFAPDWIEKYYAVKIGRKGLLLYFATITNTPDIQPIEADDFRFPDKSISNLRNDYKNIDNQYKETEKELDCIARDNIETLRFFEKRVNDKINFEKIELSGVQVAGNKLVILEGYVPEENEEQTTELLKNETLFFNVSTPLPTDDPPIKLKNNRFAQAFEMIANLYNKPNYRAFDLTPFFAPFYVIFFGLCLGDCGYGILLLIVSIFLRRSKQVFMRSAGQLVTFLAIGAIIFGFVSGSLFGIKIPELSFGWLQPLKYAVLNGKQLFWFSLIIGGVQILYALVIRLITRWMRFGFLYAFDTLGWLLAILGNAAIIILVRNGNIDSYLQMPAHFIITSLGGFMMLFFNNPEKGIRGILGSVGIGLFGLYNKISGTMGDLLSYIRLFALGISGSVMGLVFNQLASGFAPDIIVLREFVMILILLIGHSINIFIGSLGSLIHPMRLTFVEFYRNAGYDGGGKPYTPFVKTAQ